MTDNAKELLALADCPVGLFMSNGGELCLKTEYGNNDGRIDAYIVSSGEFFWGDHPQTIANQRRQLVTPIDHEELLRLSARQQASVEESGGRAIIAGDAVVIRFPLDAFQSAMDGAWALRALNTRYKITNIDEFAQEFARALNREDEQGTTAIHKMADRAFVDCIENGAFGIEEHEQQDI